MTRTEARAIARHLDLNLTELRARYPIQWDSAAGAYELEADERGCVFLDGDRCGIQPVKPEQCRAFPFWPELIEDPGAWKEAKDVCEGLDHPDGELFSLETMRERARRYRFG